MSQSEIKMTPVPKAPERKPKDDGSSKVARMKSRLALAPDLLVVDKDYSGKGDPVRAKRSAILAATNLNAGKQARWPNDEYYAAYQESPDSPGVFQRVIGRRDNLPESWREFVESACESKRKKNTEDVEEPGDMTTPEEGPSDPFDAADQDA